MKKLERSPQMELVVAEAAVAAAKSRLEAAVEDFVVAERKRLVAELRATVGRVVEPGEVP